MHSRNVCPRAGAGLMGWGWGFGPWAAPTSLSGASAPGLVSASGLRLWREVPGLVPASRAVSLVPRAGASLVGLGFWPRGRSWPLSVAVALVPRASTSLSGCGCGFKPHGWCQHPWLWLKALGSVLASQALALGPMARASLPGIGGSFKPQGWCWLPVLWLWL